MTEYFTGLAERKVVESANIINPGDATVNIFDLHFSFGRGNGWRESAFTLSADYNLKKPIKTRLQDNMILTQLSLFT